MRDELVHIVRDFAGALLNPYDSQVVLERLTRQSMELLAAAGSGIMLEGRDGELSFAAASEPRIMEIELVQERASEGACYEAYLTNEVIVVDDIRAITDWPTYASRVLENGMASVIGVPMNAFGRTIGVLNIYRDVPTPWTRDDVASAEIMAAMGAGYIVHAGELRARIDLTEQLQEAIDSRDMIGQAKGIVMARLGVDATTAFSLLRDASQSGNVKVRELAKQIVDGVIDPGESLGPRST